MMSLCNSTFFAITTSENMMYNNRRLSVVIDVIFMKAIAVIPQIVVFLRKIISEKQLVKTDGRTSEITS